MVWDKCGEKPGGCPSWTGRGEREQERRAKSRKWGQSQGRCVYVGEDWSVCWARGTESMQAVRTQRGGDTRREMCLNRMWPAEKLQESWIFSTDGLSSATHTEITLQHTERKHTVKSREESSALLSYFSVSFTQIIKSFCFSTCHNCLNHGDGKSCETHHQVWSYIFLMWVTQILQDKYTSHWEL